MWSTRSAVINDLFAYSNILHGGTAANRPNLKANLSLFDLKVVDENPSRYEKKPKIERGEAVTSNEQVEMALNWTLRSGLVDFLVKADFITQSNIDFSKRCKVCLLFWPNFPLKSPQ